MKATAYDSEGKIVKCSFCEKECGMSIISKSHQIHYCEDHSPYKNSYVAEFSYQGKKLNWGN